MRGKTILIADDDADVRELVGMNLRRAGYVTEEAADGLEALRMVRNKRPDGIVLDLMMPGCDGFEVCEELRKDEAHRYIPIIMLTAKSAVGDCIAGLQKGVDDYVGKPFSPKELVLRVEAVIRRSSNRANGSEIKAGPFCIEPANFKLLINGEHVDLTLLEFKLMHLLMSNHGVTVNREILHNEIWGHLANDHTRSLDTHVKRLRHKLGTFSGWIQTIRGHGYLCKTPVNQ